MSTDLFTASVVSLKCRDMLVKYRFACSLVRSALCILDRLRKARIAMLHESLAVFNQLPDTRFCKEKYV